MYIALNNNCWFTNIGEAFIDIGLKTLLSNILSREDNIQIGSVSPMSKFYLPSEAKNRALFNGDFFIPDMLMLSGMYAVSEMFTTNNMFGTFMYAKKIKKLGGQIAFVGLGGLEYNEKERDDVLRGMELLQPLFIVTRDQLTFNLYSDYFECIKGLDCAFWLEEASNPIGMRHKEYVVSTFNRSDEPEEIAMMKDVIHPWHMQYSLDSKKTKYLSKQNLFVSDSPYEYLTLYANASRVYTDLVHATIPSLLYKTPVKYWKYDNRRNAFEHIEYLKKDKEGFLSINKKLLQLEKESIEKYIYKQIIHFANTQ